MNGLNIKGVIILLFLCVISDSFSYKVRDKESQDGRKHKSYNQPKKEQKFYQDIYIAQLVPEEIEFGHVKETPFSWEQRFEKINLDENRHQGKVKWDNPRDGYGEYYFDFNHDHDDSDDSDDGHEEKKQKSLEDILGEGRRSLEKGEVEFIDGKSFNTISNGKQDYHGGNYKNEPNREKEKESIKEA